MVVATRIEARISWVSPAVYHDDGQTVPNLLRENNEKDIMIGR